MFNFSTFKTSLKISAAVLAIVVATEAEAKTIEVKMLNAGKEGPMVFEPGFVKAEKGDTLKFVPTDKSHNSQSLVVPLASSVKACLSSSYLLLIWLNEWHPYFGFNSLASMMGMRSTHVCHFP